jgi:hypothetical protein
LAEDKHPVSSTGQAFEQPRKKEDNLVKKSVNRIVPIIINKSILLVMGVIFLGGCSSQPIIQKANESKSAFDSALLYDGESHVVNEDLSNSQQYRIYEKGASGFVSLDALDVDAKQRANDFCN